MSRLSPSRWHTSASCRHVLGGTVCRVKLQKHESSFKHALFTALIGCGVARSSVCTACFPKMLKNQQRFHWHATKWHRQYSSCCYSSSSHLHGLMSVSYTHHDFTLLKLHNYVKSTDRMSSPCSSSFFFWPLEPGEPGRTFSRQQFQIKGGEDDKR